MFYLKATEKKKKEMMDLVHIASLKVFQIVEQVLLRRRNSGGHPPHQMRMIAVSGNEKWRSRKNAKMMTKLKKKGELIHRTKSITKRTVEKLNTRSLRRTRSEVNVGGVILATARVQVTAVPAAAVVVIHHQVLPQIQSLKNANLSPANGSTREIDEYWFQLFLMRLMECMNSIFQPLVYNLKY